VQARQNMTISNASELRHGVRNHLNNISVNAELIKLLASKNPEQSAQIIASVEKILNECKLCAERMSEHD